MRSKIGPESTPKRSRKRRTKTTKKGPKKHTSGTSFGRPKNLISAFFLWYPHFRGVLVPERVQKGHPKHVQSPPKINPKTDQNGFQKNGNPTRKNHPLFQNPPTRKPRAIRHHGFLQTSSRIGRAHIKRSARGRYPSVPIAALPVIRRPLLRSSM